MAITGFRKGFLILLLAVAGGGTVLWAQLPATAVVSASPASEVDAGAVRLLVGRSTVLDVGTPNTRFYFEWFAARQSCVPFLNYCGYIFRMN